MLLNLRAILGVLAFAPVLASSQDPCDSPSCSAATTSGEQDDLLLIQRHRERADNPCLSCDTCEAVENPTQGGVNDNACKPCANGEQTWWPCNSKPAQCQCGNGIPTLKPTPNPTATSEPSYAPTPTPTPVPTTPQPTPIPTPADTPDTPDPTPSPTAGTPVPTTDGTPGPYACAECHECISVPGNYQSVVDSQCAVCARNGQSWWPCDVAGLCMCGGPTPTPTETPTASPTPAPPPTPVPPTPPTPPTTSPTPGGAYCTATPTTPCTFTPGAGISSWFTKDLFEQMFPHLCDPACHGCQMLTYECMIQATLLYPEFANSTDMDDNKRELAAWFGEMSQETTGGGCNRPTVVNSDGTCSCGPTWCDSEPDGGCARWGLCFVEESAGTYCDSGVSSLVYPCMPGREYRGRGPKQLSYNYNYGQFSRDFCDDKYTLLDNPGWVASNPILAWSSSIWFWFTGGACLQGEKCKPNCHEVFLGLKPKCQADKNAGRQYGLGWVTNVINGGLECGGAGEGPCDYRVYSRVRFYKHFCSILGVSPLKEGWSDGNNLFCEHQQNYATSPPTVC